MSGVEIFINLFFLLLLLFLCYYSLKKKEQFLQVTRLVNPMNLPVQMASASHTRGVVILMMTVVIILMKTNVVSVVVFLKFLILCTSAFWESSHA